ncbi:YMGG-like glycine zipper-containing protein [Ruegeria arenilitoris]|uniref:YMGG-like glycine zipper-containing protein n=1 Tax=Ruegeria arenilitoris TaxID=1173585 RepID=UPI00147EDE24|nr:YMGG-like glycine zipper-containing protein [Ruegeria arenilitoris]
MKLIQIPTIATLAFALGISLVLPTPTDAGNRQVKNTLGGAAIGAGVGALVGGSSGARTGAVVGAIAGAVK